MEFDYETDPRIYRLGVEAIDEDGALIKGEFDVIIIDVWENLNNGAFEGSEMNTKLDMYSDWEKYNSG